MKRRPTADPEIAYHLVDLPPKHSYYPCPRKQIVTESGVVIGEMEHIDPAPYWRSVGYLDESSDEKKLAAAMIRRWLRKNENRVALAKKESDLDY